MPRWFHSKFEDGVPFATSIGHLPACAKYAVEGQTAEIAIASAGVEAHLLPQSALTLNDDGTLGVRLIDAANTVSFAAVTLVRDTPEGIWVTGLPEQADVIVLGQEYVTAGVTVTPTFRDEAPE